MRVRRLTTTLAAVFIAAATTLAGVSGATAAGPTGRAPVAKAGAAANAGELVSASTDPIPAALAEETVGSRLNPGQSMDGATQYLESPSGQFAVAADDGFGDEGLYWTSWSSGAQLLSMVGVADDHRVLVMQTDGNLVLYVDGSTPNFASGTQGNPGAFAVLQDDGNLVVYSAAGKPLWWSGTFAHDMFACAYDVESWTSYLDAGWYISSPQGKYKLTMQGDGNLVLYSMATGRAIWHTGTHGNPGAFTAFQGDGNLVVYSASGKPLWNSGKTRSEGIYTLTPQDDGNLVNYWLNLNTGKTSPLWASGTQGKR